MPSTPFDAPLRLELKPSKALRAMVTAAHGAVAVILVLGLHQRIYIAVGFALLLTSLIWWMRYIRRDWILQWDSDGCWQLWRGSGRNRQHLEHLQLSKAVYISPTMVSFSLSQVGRIVIMPDAIGVENHRRLRARLHLWSQPSSPA